MDLRPTVFGQPLPKRYCPSRCTVDVGFPETSKIYLPGRKSIGKAIWWFSGVAETLKNIAKFGPNFLYQGNWRSTVDYLQSIGGIIRPPTLKITEPSRHGRLR
ncbi:MAG: hypothetical protein CM1200mP9_10860 [Gammaproteobacteria bacterium]|nr:MAG: hypothetical protein CM1200mP9_10860 [Gammaproteobacteria bacterium]